MSDEGEMDYDQGVLPAAEVAAWCTAMLQADRTGSIATEPLESLHLQFARGRAP